MAVTVTFLGHGCFSFETGGKTLLVDPFFTGNPAAATSADKVAADLIVVTHGHGDHVGDTVAIAERTGCVVVANFEICEWLRNQGVKNASDQHIGGVVRHGLGDEEVAIKLTIAHHGSMLPDGSNGGNPCGVLLKFPDCTVYHAADTGLFYDMKLIGDEGIDLAILPIGDRYTMGPDDALKAVKLIRPKRVIPDHYDTWPIIEQDAAAWAKRVKKQTIAKAIVLKPGESCALGSRGKRGKAQKSKRRGR